MIILDYKKKTIEKETYLFFPAINMLFALLILFIPCGLAALGKQEDHSILFYWKILYKEEQNNQEVIDPSSIYTELKTGTVLNFYIEEQNTHTYVYLLHFDSTENFNMLFPANFKQSAFREAYRSAGWHLSGYDLEEYFYILGSNKRLKELEKQVREIQQMKNNAEKKTLIYMLHETVESSLKENSPLHYSDIEEHDPYGGAFRTDLFRLRVSNCTSYARKIRIKH